jgi:hypothetical protein
MNVEELDVKMQARKEKQKQVRLQKKNQKEK